MCKEFPAGGCRGLVVLACADAAALSVSGHIGGGGLQCEASLGTAFF